jgi:malate synthase
MEDMATGEIRLSILWEWLHKDAILDEDDLAVSVRAGDKFSSDLFLRLLSEEYEKLTKANNKDVFDASKSTSLPISKEIVRTYVLSKEKFPWFIDLLNINLDNFDLEKAKQRIRIFIDAFTKDGTRITENVDFPAASI